MKRTWRKKIGAVVALLAAVAVLGTGCGADAAGTVESRTRETRALGLLLSREDTFLSELKADIEAEAAAQGYAVRKARRSCWLTFQTGRTPKRCQTSWATQGSCC